MTQDILGSNLDGGDANSLVLGPEVLAQVIDTPPPEPVVRAVNDFFKEGKRVKILLEENDNIPPTGQFIGVQGRGYMLMPGCVAEVPIGVINVLNDAIMSTPEIDPNTQQVIGYRDKLRFPYRIVP